MFYIVMFDRIPVQLIIGRWRILFDDKLSYYLKIVSIAGTYFYTFRSIASSYGIYFNVSS